MSFAVGCAPTAERCAHSPKTCRSVYAPASASLPPHIDQVLTTLETINVQIRAADREIRSIARNDEVCRRLMTAPGVGPITAVRFRAAIDDVTRFRSAHAVESYLGLVPGEYSSSNTQHRLGITKAGSTRLRTSLIQSAWCARRCEASPG